MSFRTGFENWGSQGKYIPPVEAQPVNHWWRMPLNIILGGAGFLTVFIPGLDTLVPQFFIAEGITSIETGVNYGVGASPSRWGTFLGFGLPVLFASGEIWNNVGKWGSWTKPPKAFFRTVSRIKEDLKDPDLVKMLTRGYPASMFAKKATDLEFNKRILDEWKWSVDIKANWRDILSADYINSVGEENIESSFNELSYGVIRPEETDLFTSLLNRHLAIPAGRNGNIEKLNDFYRRLNREDFSDDEEYETLINILDDILKNPYRLNQQSIHKEFDLIRNMLQVNPSETSEFYNNVVNWRTKNASKFKLDIPNLTVAVSALKDLQKFGENKFFDLWGFKPFRAELKQVVKKKVSYRDVTDWLGNSRTARWITGMTRMLNPTMIARLPENIAYKAATASFRKDWKNFRAFKNFIQKIGNPAIKASAALNKTLEEEGFVELPSSWLLGLRVIENYFEGDLLLLSFQSGPTYGKSPVLIRANNEQLSRLLVSPGRTYLQEWATSRGGASVSLAAVFDLPENKQTAEIFHKFNLLPTQAIRRLLSVASNLKKAKDRNWSGHHFFQTMELYSISKTTRFGARVMFGDMANKYIGKLFRNDASKFKHLLAHAVPMEAQRISTMFVAQPMRNVLKGGKYSTGLLRNFRIDTAKVFRDQARFAASMKNPNAITLKTLRGSRKGMYLRRGYKIFK